MGQTIMPSMHAPRLLHIQPDMIVRSRQHPALLNTTKSATKQICTKRRTKRHCRLWHIASSPSTRTAHEHTKHEHQPQIASPPVACPAKHSSQNPCTACADIKQEHQATQHIANCQNVHTAHVQIDRMQPNSRVHKIAHTYRVQHSLQTRQLKQSKIHEMLEHIDDRRTKQTR